VADRRDGGLKMDWTKPLLILGWISDRDPVYPEVIILRDALSNRGACGDL
jgi:hypothetical protein